MGHRRLRPRECFVERYRQGPATLRLRSSPTSTAAWWSPAPATVSAAAPVPALVEEETAPFLTDEQRTKIHESAKAICREAGITARAPSSSSSATTACVVLGGQHPSAGGDPVTEETAGIDLVRQQFRIANGEKLEFTEDPAPRGHAFEFRINGGDIGRGSARPGPISVYSGPRPGRARRLRRGAGRCHRR